MKRGEGDPWKRVRVGGCTQRQTKNIKRQSDTQEREQRLLREVQTKNGGTERLFNDRHRVSQRSERKREGPDKKRLKSRKGKQQTEK